MKYIIITILISLNIFAATTQTNKPLYTVTNVPKNMSVATKKARFFYLVEPAVQKVHAELMQQYKDVLKDIKNSTNSQKIKKLKKLYRVQSDKELLLALKPHPQSIVLAQAAMESAWATSRFFVQANNIFGIRSVNDYEPRIVAGKRKNIWLRKFASVEDSVREYYIMMGRVKIYKDFRDVRYNSNDVMKMVQKLDKYSEIDKQYTKELSSMIRHNNLTKYDK